MNTTNTILIEAVENHHGSEHLWTTLLNWRRRFEGSHSRYEEIRVWVGDLQEHIFPEEYAAVKLGLTAADWCDVVYSYDFFDGQFWWSCPVVLYRKNDEYGAIVNPELKGHVKAQSTALLTEALTTMIDNEYAIREIVTKLEETEVNR